MIITREDILREHEQEKALREQHKLEDAKEYTCHPALKLAQCPSIEERREMAFEQLVQNFREGIEERVKKEDIKWVKVDLFGFMRCSMNSDQSNFLGKLIEHCPDDLAYHQSACFYFEEHKELIESIIKKTVDQYYPDLK